MRSKAGTSATDKASFEELIDGVKVMVAIMTGSWRDGREYSDYFLSPACQHELARASTNRIPVVFVRETDPTHGGISMEAHRRGCPANMLLLLDESRVVEWHRVQAYQDISLKCILQEVLQDLAISRTAHMHNSPRDGVYLRREVVREPLQLQPAPDDAFHLYISKHNVGAEGFVRLLERYLSTTSAKQGKKAIYLATTSSKMNTASHFLCYLNALTHQSGETTVAFHAELEAALRAGIHILLVHEMRREANGSTFSAIVDATPEELKWDRYTRTKRLCKVLRVELYCKCGYISLLRRVFDPVVEQIRS